MSANFPFIGGPAPSARRRAGTRAAVLAAAALLAAGCAARAVTVPPGALPEPPPSWAAADDGAATAAVGGWLDDFDAPGLAGLVDAALAANPDLAAAGARMAAARAQARIAGAPRLPSVTVGLDGARTKRAPSGISAASARPVTTYSLDATVAWEADLWGRLGDTARAAAAERTAAEADFSAARLALAAEVAREWFRVAEAGQQQALAERTVASFARSREVIEERYRTGLVDALDVRLARENEATARANLAQRRRERDAALRGLEVLLGRYPSASLDVAAALPRVRGPVPVGLPAELLARRPDLIAAEARLHAAGSRIGAAKKARLPSVTLTAAGGTASDRLRDLLDWDRLVWSLVGGITEPLFSGGRISAQIELAQADGNASVYAYAAAVLAAFREVEAALSAEARYAGQSEALSVAAAESAEAAGLAFERYAQGLADIVTLLEAQRRAFSAESARLRTAREALDNRVNLYLALGGDFATPVPLAAAAAAPDAAGSAALHSSRPEAMLR